MGKNEKVALLILLLLLLLMFWYLSQQLEDQANEDDNADGTGWTTGPPFGGPPASTQGDIAYADIPPTKLWAMILQLLLEAGLEQVQQQMENQQEQVQTEINTEINTQIDTNINSETQTQINITIAQVQAAVNVLTQINIEGAESTIQTQLMNQQAQLENQVNIQVGEPNITTTNTEIQKSLKALQEQLKNQVNAQASVGVSIDPVLNQSIQTQLELIRQQVEASAQTSQPTVTTTTNAEIQTSLKTLKEQLENQVNAQASGGPSINPVLASVQSQLELIRQQIEYDNYRRDGNVPSETNANIQTQLELVRQQIEYDNYRRDGNVPPETDANIQTQLELDRQKIEYDNYRRDGNVPPETDANIQTQLELERQKIESGINTDARHVAARKTRLHTGRLASSETTRLIEGNVEIIDPYSPRPTFKRTYRQTFKGSVAAAFGYVPRKMSGRAPEWGRKMKLYMLNLKQKVSKNQWYKNAKDPWNNIDIGANAGKAGMFALEFVDFFDEICDKVSIAATFVDGFLYDPNGTGLDWYPLSNNALDQVAQQSVKLQLEEYAIYNSDEIRAKYPLIAGPLDLLEKDVTAGRSSRNDPEYAQRRVEYEVDAIRLKILNDTSQPYRQKILNSEFGGSEAELQAYLAKDPLNSILDYDGLLSPTDYDSVYVYAFTEVCSYHKGKTYVDTYTDADGNPGRKKPQCGWATKDECTANATTWIDEKGQIGSYGEWFTWNQLNTIFTNLKAENPSFVAPLTTTSPLYQELYTNGICLVTGAGQHFSCKEAGGIYDAGIHRCGFTQEICQYYGTCYDDVTTKNCFIPKGLDQAQNFLGQSFPREWIRLHGCLKDGNSDARFEQVLNQAGNFLTNTNTRFFDDIAKNKKNWSEGMKASFSDPDTIANFAMIVLPGLLGMGTGPSMIAIAFVVGGMMADKSLKANVEFAQKPPSIPAEYTVGGWKSNHTDAVVLKDRFKVTGITVSLLSSQPGALGFPILTVYLTFTTDKPHGFLIGDKVYHQGLSEKIGQVNFYDATGQNTEFTVNQIPTLTTFRINQVYSIGTTQDIDPTGVYVYTKTLPATAKVYDKTTKYIDVKNLAGSPVTKVAMSVGFVDGWLTKPLRPRTSDGTTLVLETEGVDKIAGVVEQEFFIDVRPHEDSDQQVPLINGCSAKQYSDNRITTSCVNTAYNENYSFAADFDGSGFDAMGTKCSSVGMRSVGAFSELCKKATAADVACGFVESPDSTTKVGRGFEWAPLQKYKRLCSERDNYGLGAPMIRAWDAPHVNKTWCIPELPPLSWVNTNIGQLNTVETAYARNRAWTGGVDPYSPEVHMTVVEEGGNYEVGDSAKYWYYQLVYDPELFNRNVLWDDTLLNDNFSISTISEMRRYYCLKDFKTFYEAETLNQLDKRCWGYTSISTTNYSFTPMTNVGHSWDDMVTHVNPGDTFIG